MATIIRSLWLLLRKHRNYILVIYAAIELRAYVRYKAVALRLASFRTPMSLAFPRLAWRHYFKTRLCLEARKRPSDLRIFIEKIFWNRPVTELSRPAVKRWLRMYLSNYEDEERPPMWSDKHLADGRADSGRQARVSEAQEVHADADHLCGILENSFGCKFSDGPEQDFIRINSLATNHTPPTPLFPLLPLRIGKFMFRAIAQGIFRQLGFVRHRDEATGMEFWCREGSGPGLLFVHAVGFGLAPYAGVIWELAHRYSGPIILGELPTLGGSPPRANGTPFPRAEELAESVEKMKDKQGIHTLHACGHSLGGTVLSSMLKYKPKLFTRIAYVESPVFFFRATDGWPMIFQPHSVSSLVTRVRNGEFRDAASDIFLSDVWQQHVIHHAIWFWEFCSFEEDLDENTLVILGEKDRLVSISIRDWLVSEHPRVQVETHSGDHGGVVLPHEHMKWFVDRLSRFLGEEDQLKPSAGLSRTESATRLTAGLISTCLPFPRSESAASLARSEH
eukprot:TRINITY_DN72007_c0_g1_i1.p1 TRINITY_DN72007_c0_g1~~TRINITY_DN72007_c0_g1_i1.p1  ORF type:complete len:506 (-),score=51.01 TRINITY_DN72007_c0_g1_i1:69-1586(-)